MKLVAVILTLDEEIHLSRCLASLDGIADQIWVVDSHSTDDTEQIARAHGAFFVRHPFRNQSSQFNWALGQLDEDTDWVFRLDADEYLTPALREEVRARLPRIDPATDGVIVGRQMIFGGRRLRFGGLFPVQVLRLFRYGHGRCEERWMDEHIQVDGRTERFDGCLVDHNLQPLSWWLDKHNRYASREAVEMLNLKYGFLPKEDSGFGSAGRQASTKRWLKERIYARIPGGVRALLYFLYRYVIRLGFLDGRAGALFHVMQGFWYRYLVDVKVAEVERYMIDHRVGVIDGIGTVLGIELDNEVARGAD